MNILITGSFQLNKDQKEELEALGHRVDFHQEERLPVKNPGQYQAVVCNGLFLHQPIETFTDLQIIQLTSAGLDRVPIEYIESHGIRLYRAAGVYSVPMAEFAIGGILQIYKQSRFFADRQKQHRWEKHRGLLELSGKTACILGCGDLGQEIARRLQAFGCHVVGANRTWKGGDRFLCFDRVFPLEQLAEAAAMSDIFICCIALTEGTRGIISQDIFRQLKPGAVFVNLARGGLVDQEALIRWLQGREDRGEGENSQDGKGCGGAVLDVFQEEPLPEDSPLWDMEQVILTPHNSFVGEGNPERLWRKIKENLV